MTKVTVEVEVVTVACEIIALPGEKLMVLNGTVIGTVPKDVVTVSSVHNMTVLPVNTVSNLNGLTRHEVHSLNWRAKVESALNQHGPMNARELGDALGFARNDAKSRNVLSAQLRRLLSSSFITKVDNGNIRYFTYTLADRLASADSHTTA